MVLKLYGSYRSPFFSLVIAILHEKQVPFEQVDAKGENNGPEYLAKQPFGQIPCIVRDSLPFESQITHYIYCSAA
jgi:glutathione S-transferase